MADTEFYCPKCDAFTPDHRPSCPTCGSAAFLPQIRDIKRLEDALGDSYEVKGVLGEGSYGVVFAVHDKALGRALAVKVLKEANRELITRFSREVSILGNLRHQSIVPLFFATASKGVAYMVMPLLRGKPLRSFMKRQDGRPFEDAVAAAGEIAAGLDEAHRMGVVHRDIKPENVFVEEPGGRLCIMDFGIARIVTPEGQAGMKATIIGTPEYMSPEQIRGDSKIDGRSDTYSLACVVHEIVTGRPPFPAKGNSTPRSLFVRHISEPPPPLRTLRPEVPKAMEDAVLKALSKQPSDRHATAGEFAAELQAAAKYGGGWRSVVKRWLDGP